jgi:hypothetical protein
VDRFVWTEGSSGRGTETPNEWEWSLRDREEVGLETGDHKDIGEGDRTKGEGSGGLRATPPTTTTYIVVRGSRLPALHEGGSG